ncbi:DNA ligase [Acrasis kona]|uniref:DNA ligase n=1 Tax=Acrasis kona TaxID=1008807 RepID=A0AAW2YUM1_9EUKA
MKLSLNMSALTKPVVDSPTQQEQIDEPMNSPPKPFVKALNLSSIAPKLDLKPTTPPQNKSQKKVVDVSLLVSNFVKVEVDENSEVSDIKTAVHRELGGIFNTKSDEFKYDLVETNNGSSTSFTCSPQIKVNFSALLELKKQNHDLLIKLEKTVTALQTFERSNNELREQVQAQKVTIQENERHKDQTRELVNMLKAQHKELVTSLSPTTTPPTSNFSNLDLCK